MRRVNKGRSNMDLKALVLNKINENLANTYAQISTKLTDTTAIQLVDCSLIDLDSIKPLIEKTHNLINLDIIANNLARDQLLQDETDFDDIILCSNEYNDDNLESYFKLDAEPADIPDLVQNQLGEQVQTDFDDIILCSDEYNDDNLESDLKLDANISKTDNENLDLILDDFNDKNLKITSEMNVSKLPDVTNSISFEMIKESLEKNNVAMKKITVVSLLEPEDMIDLDTDTIKKIIKDLETNNVAVKKNADRNTIEAEDTSIIDLDKDTIQNLMKDELMDLDFADLNLSGANDPEDIAETDIESLIKVNKILNNKETFNASLDRLDSGKVEIEITPFTLEPLKATVENSFSTISINLTESDSECEGYHSSDFEFITESEAKLELFVTKKRKNKMKRKTSTKTWDSQRNEHRNILGTTVVEKNRPGPSRMTEPAKNQDTLKYWSKSYNRSLRVEQYKKDAKYNRENHTIPEGENYFDLFRGNHCSLSALFENKSIIPSACMQAHNKIGFSQMKFADDEALDAKTLKEAEDNAKKILAKYPVENRKRCLRSTSRRH